MNTLLSFLLLFSLQSDTVTLTVFKVRDGDTIEARTQNGSKVVIRFHGVDSPDKCQPFYEEAKQFAKDQLLNKIISYVETDNDDGFGRSVGEIFIDAANTTGEFGVWFNSAIVAAGFAWYWPKYSDSEKLALSQATAKKYKVGLWALPNPMPPWEYRRTEAYQNCNIGIQ